MRKRMPRVSDNDWMKGPQPSYGPYDFDIKPTYRSNPMYEVDIDSLGSRGERSHPIPKWYGLSGYKRDSTRYNGLSGFTRNSNRVQRIGALKPKAKPKMKPKTTTQVRRVASKPKAKSTKAGERERLIGVGILMLIGYTGLKLIFNGNH